MGHEVEVKLQVPPAELRALAKAPRLVNLADKPPKQAKLLSVYFDTPKRALRDAGLSLRIRKTPDSHIQTIKYAGSSGIDRCEWERRVPGARPVRKYAKATALKPFAGKKQWRELRPVFETDVTRTTYPVVFGGSSFEIALDRGRIRSKGRTDTISEAEIELVDGSIADVPALVRKFAAGLPASFGLASKAERGYALADKTAGEHHAAREIHLSADLDTARGFQAVALNCLEHVTQNRDAVLRGDAEGVHQMRVGLRRLRTAISLFQDLVEGRDTEAVKQNLKWMSEQLNQARDFDVFLDEAKSETADEKDRTGLKSLTSDLAERREEGLARAKRLVRSDRYRNHVLQTGLWILGGDWVTGGEPLLVAKRRRALTDTAGEILSARCRKVRKKLRRFDKLDDRGRHKLRIAVKKLRYGCAFFETLFAKPGKAEARFAKGLKTLQSALGRLNDIRVHKSFARKAVGSRSRQTGKRSYGLGFVTGKESAVAAQCLKKARKAANRFRKLKTYW